METVEMRALRWAASGKTGASSMAMLRTMIGEPPKDGFCYPSDAGDLGRCIGLLEAVPEYRARLNEMKAIGPEWSALVDNWPTLEARWRRDDPLLYDHMKKLLNPLEEKRPGLIKVGKHAKIYFSGMGGK